MMQYIGDQDQKKLLSLEDGRVACCDCGLPIAPTDSNTCVSCLRARVDASEGIPTASELNSCRNCERYFQPPNAWIPAKLESKELMTICLKRMKAALDKVKLLDASFVWTEPHSKRVKISLKVQREIEGGAMVEQTVVVEFIVRNQMCEDCHRIEAKDYWRACVQVRQKCDYKRTILALQQMIQQQEMHKHASEVKNVHTGIDLFYARKQEAKKLVEFICSVLPSKHYESRSLVTHDASNNVYDYKHTFCVEIAPVVKDSLICLPKKVAHALGCISQFVLCLRIASVITLMDPATLHLREITTAAYWKTPFEMLCQPKQLTEFFVLEVEEVEAPAAEKAEGSSPKGYDSRKFSTRHKLGYAWVLRGDKVGQSDAQTFGCRHHLGYLLSPGDTVLGYEITNSNLNNSTLDSLPQEIVPDVVLVRKVYPKEG